MIKNDNIYFYFRVLSLLTRLKTHFMPFLEDIKIQVLESKYYIPFEPLKCSSGVYSKRIRVLGKINRIFLFRDLRLKYKIIEKSKNLSHSSFKAF